MSLSGIQIFHSFGLDTRYRKSNDFWIRFFEEGLCFVFVGIGADPGFLSDSLDVRTSLLALTFEVLTKVLR